MWWCHHQDDDVDDKEPGDDEGDNPQLVEPDEDETTPSQDDTEQDQQTNVESYGATSQTDDQQIIEQAAQDKGTVAKLSATASRLFSKDLQDSSFMLVKIISCHNCIFLITIKLQFWWIQVAKQSQRRNKELANQRARIRRRLV